MKKTLTQAAWGAGVFLCAGFVGAAWELFLDIFFRFTEPLAPGAWWGALFQRAKVYTAFALGLGALAALVWWGVRAIVRRVKRGGGRTPVARVGYAGAFAAPLAATPLWYFLGNWDVEFLSSDTFRIVGFWIVSWLALFFLFLRASALGPRANAAARRVAGVAGGAALLVFLGHAALSGVTRPRPARGLPDVVIITLDACRADRVGRPGADGATLTPNIDRFAAGAYEFTQCRAQATWTSPSLATLHTSQYPFVHGATADRPLGVSQPTLASILRTAGYDTEGVVANRLCHRDSGLARGFGSYSYWTERPALKRLGYYHTYFAYLESLLYEKHNIQTFRNEGHTKVLTDYVVRTLRAKRRRPVFLWVHYLDPHVPYNPPPRYVTPGDRRHLGKVSQGDVARSALTKRFYDGEVRYVDAELARVFAVLRPNSLVVISSDHGEEFFEHGNVDHGKSLYDEVLRVPLIIRVPGGGHAVTAAPVGLIDVAPTILSTLGLKPPRSFQGRNIIPAVRAASWDYPVFFGSSMLVGGRRYGVVYRNRKLMLEHTQAMADAEYYDLGRDAGEKTPITGKGDANRRQLEGFLQGWIGNNVKVSRQFRLAPFSRAVSDRLRAMGYIQ